MNENKFIEYINLYKDEFYSFLYHNLTDKSKVDDVFSEAILTAYENKDKFIEGTNFRAWMYKILLNKCFTANRDISLYWEPIEEYSEKIYFFPNNYSNSTGHNHKDTTETDLEKFLENCSEDVYNAFQKLSPLQRWCVYLKDVKNLSYKEIAEILSIPLSSVMTYLSRGRAKLKILLLQKVGKNKKLIPDKTTSTTASPVGEETLL
ncbi:MAG: RNA polymerase sigma factor [Candidatus Hydrogenedentes bacterium]|nr:RNA polymerase sigma factor [Candidatus Hydrogenedentota bacterium]